MPIEFKKVTKKEIEEKYRVKGTLYSEIANALKNLKPGEGVELTVSTPGSAYGIAKYFRELGYEVHTKRVSEGYTVAVLKPEKKK
jgi:TusA-related sulfurtransferase